MKHAVFMALIVSTGLAVSAVSAEAKGGHGTRASFAELDANNDGALTPDEMKAHHAGRFEATDTDGDGLLSVEELMIRTSKDAEARVQAMIARFDANKDGMLSRDELPAPGAKHEKRANRFFEKADADGNGALSQEEFDTARANLKDRAKGPGGKPGKSAD
ncbi:MAG: EF-hand domain-containing protein [Marinibacterium sp.]|nr:EF-hand domain-containing protein [Marinibacterium sp.]